MENLNSHNNNNPFGVPEGYFESLEDMVMTGIAVEELKAIAPNSGFKVPDHYFAKLENKVTTRLQTKDTVKVIPLVRSKTLLGLVAMAACILLIVTIFNAGNKNNVAVSLADVETETLESFINSDAIAYSKDELVNFYTDSDLEFSGTSSEVISNDDLEDYLVDYMDSEDLIQQYD